MWSKRLMKMVMAGMAVLVWGTSVTAQECSRPPAKVAVLEVSYAPNVEVYLLCDKAKAPACTVTFWCAEHGHPAHGSYSGQSPQDPVTWDVGVEPGTVFRYTRGDARYRGETGFASRSFVAAIENAGWEWDGEYKVCVVRSNDPVEVAAQYYSSSGSLGRGLSQRISPPEPYPCPSSNATLSSLTVSGEGTLRPSFNSDTTEYTFTTRATRVAFTPTAADSGATIRVNNTVVQSGAASGNLAVPWPRLPITVTAEDGTTTRTYYVTTTRFGP